MGSLSAAEPARAAVHLRCMWTGAERRRDPASAGLGANLYTFLYVSPNGTIPNVEFAACADDAAACREAGRRLQQRGERAAVEVWSEQDRVCVVRRDDAEPPGQPNPSSSDRCLTAA